MIRGLSGLEPERLSATELRFHRGSVVHANGTEEIRFGSSLTLDTSQDGSLGMAYCDFNVGGDYFPYVIRNTVNGECSITLSNQISVSSVILPSSNWEVVRKLPWGFRAINGIYVPGGVSGRAEIPTFHICNWPKPYTALTQATTESNFCKVLSNGTDTSFTSFPCSKIIPDNARLAKMLFEVTGGDVKVRSGTFQGEGIKMGPGLHHIDIRVVSDLTMQYKSEGGTLNAFVTGYYQTEPS